MFNRNGIKALMERYGGDATRVADYLESRLILEAGNHRRITVEEFSLREIAEGLGGNMAPDTQMFSESVTASQFQTLVGVLLSTIAMKAYNAATTIADKLVTKFPSTLESDKIPGGALTGNLESIGENKPYPHTSDISEKYVTIGHDKRGLILDITDEAVRFDRTGIVMREATRLGTRMALDRETRIIKTILDITSFKAWRPSGSQTDVFQNAQGDGVHDLDNLVTNKLENFTDVEAAHLLLKLMQDDNGDYIRVEPKILLVPEALTLTATRIIKNVVMPGGANMERNPFADRFEIVSSPLLDAQSPVEWYLGDFKEQFLEKVVIAPQVMTRRMGDNNDDAWNTDVVASYKVRYDTMPGATDYRFVVKSSGTV